MVRTAVIGWFIARALDTNASFVEIDLSIRTRSERPLPTQSNRLLSLKNSIARYFAFAQAARHRERI